MIDVKVDLDDAEHDQCHNAFQTKTSCLEIEKWAEYNLHLEKAHSWKFENNSVWNNIDESINYK